MDCFRNQRAISVLGMHRSGTSAVTRILNLMGVNLGNNLMPPAPENPKGFWENLDFVNINEEILSDFGTSWDEVTPIFINPDISLNHEFNKFKDRIINYVLTHFSKSSLWGWKDPRTCLFFPLWSETLKTLGIITDVVLVWRNPVSVAKSLANRNGFTSEKSYRLWYSYNLLALYHSRYNHRIVINYDNLMDNWQKVISKVSDTLQLPWPVDQERFISNVETFINPSLRHSQVSYDQTVQELPSYAAELFDILIKTQTFDDLVQDKINSIYRLYSSLEQSNATVIQNASKLMETANIKLYYSENTIFSEEQSFSKTVMKAKEMKYNFELTLNKPLHLRLDPLDCPGIIDILKIKVLSDDEKLLFSFDLNCMSTDNLLRDNLLKDCLILNGPHSFYLITTSNDPQIIIPPFDITVACKVNISLRIIDFISIETSKVYHYINQKYMDMIQEQIHLINIKTTTIKELEKTCENKSTTITLLEEQISEYKYLVNSLNEVIQAGDQIIENYKREYEK